MLCLGVDSNFLPPLRNGYLCGPVIFDPASGGIDSLADAIPLAAQIRDIEDEMHQPGPPRPFVEREVSKRVENRSSERQSPIGARVEEAPTLCVGDRTGD